MDIQQHIKQQIAQHPIIVYMKGTPEEPQCGFSAKVAQLLMACGEKFAYIDVLANPDIRQELPKVAKWPTFPQLYIRGELVGGCDIVSELYESGELQSMVKQAMQEPDEES